MKKFNLQFLMLLAFSFLATSGLMAQAKLSTSTKSLLKKAAQTENFAARNMEKAKVKNTFLPISKQGDTYIVSGLMQTNDLFDLQQFNTLGGTVGTHTTAVSTFRIPLNQLEAMTQITGINFIQVDRKINLRLDEAVADTHAGDVHAGTNLPQAYTGAGTVVGILDIGLDMTHPTFRDADGNSRIKAVWAQNVSMGTPPANYAYGTEVTDPADLLDLGITSDENTHGTHTASIAAGRGVGADQTLKGMAPDADIVFVQPDFENVGESAIVDAISYIFDYAASVGKPAVINMSLGHHNGPHDGTTLTDQFMDGIVGAGKVLTGSASNEGSSPIHIQYGLMENDTLISAVGTINVGGNAEVSVWGDDANSDFSAKVTFISTGGVLLGETEFLPSTVDAQGQESFLNDNIEIMMTAEASNMFNQKPNMAIAIQIAPSASDTIFTVLRITGTTGGLHTWSEAGFNSFGNPLLTDGNSEYSCNEIGGIANGIISVGAHTTKTSYNDLMGNPHMAHGTVVGEIAPFSSRGPTADGRIKPDISAPGDVIVAAINAQVTNVFQEWAPFYEYTEGADSWFFAGGSGTSQSAPAVAGIIALMLEANPALTAAEVKQIIQNTARTDSFTGTLPAGGNTTWGAGKIDALAALIEVSGMVPTEELTNAVNPAVIFPNPVADNFNIVFEDTYENVQVRLTDLAGKLIWEQHLGDVQSTTKQYDVSTVPAGVYLLTLRGDNVFQTSKLIKK